jgi:hypothetical protein
VSIISFHHSFAIQTNENKSHNWNTTRFKFYISKITSLRKEKKIWNSNSNWINLTLPFHMFFFFLDSRKPHSSESVLCGPRWASKNPAVPDSYKRCTSWLELETCCADLKPFTITLRLLRTPFHMLLILYIFFSFNASHTAFDMLIAICDLPCEKMDVKTKKLGQDFIILDSKRVVK